MRRACILYLLKLISVLCGYADVYYTVQPVDYINFEGNIWNLSDAEAQGSEFNYRLEKNDSTCRLWSPAQRFDLLGDGESLLLTCSETRRFKVLFSPGILVNKHHTLSTSVDSFYIKGRIMQSDFIAGRGVHVSETSRRGYCTGFTGDSYSEAVLLHDKLSFDWHVSKDSLVSIDSVASDDVCTTTIDSYRIMVDGDEFPRAFKRKTATRYLSQAISADSIFWVSEPAYNSSNNSTVKSKLRLTDIITNKLQNNVNSLELKDPTLQVCQKGKTLYISSANNGMGHLLICDAIGRVFYESGLNLSGDILQVKLPNLPKGEYIISINDESQNNLYVSKILFVE